MASGTVLADIEYLKRLDLYEREKPFQIFIPIEKDAEDQRATNLEFEAKQQRIVDIRGISDSFSLDSQGFQVRDCPTKLDHGCFENHETVESQYLPEVERILRTADSSIDRVFIFDWRLRNSDVPRDSAAVNMNDLTTWLRPALRVHVDQSPRAVVHRIQLQLKDDSMFLLRGRVRIINVWRPLENPVEDYPLAVCDGTTVSDEDLVECDHVRRKFKGATFYSHFSPDHKWYYLSLQKPDEVLLLKMFDSDPGVKAKRCPHTSFRHPLCPPDPKPRKSIEVRALVFNYAQGVEVQHHAATAQPREMSD